jgi:hypothetical protein
MDAGAWSNRRRSWKRRFASPARRFVPQGPFVRRPAVQKISFRTMRPYAMNAMRRASTPLVSRRIWRAPTRTRGSRFVRTVAATTVSRRGPSRGRFGECPHRTALAGPLHGAPTTRPERSRDWENARCMALRRFASTFDALSESRATRRIGRIKLPQRLAPKMRVRRHWTSPEAKGTALVGRSPAMWPASE